jgi:predicted aldo/keto reductase-like oxidoreductase
MNRRQFIQSSAAAATASVAASSMAQQSSDLDFRNQREDRMPYRKLGRTNFMSSRLIFGCGAALIGGRAVKLLDRAYEAGVNCFDVGSNDYYKGAEQHLAAFAKRNRGDIWITSKGYARSGADHTPGEDVSVEYAKGAATYWLNLVDQSLIDLQSDYIDAYLIQGTNEPSLMLSDEINAAFEKVKSSGKIGHVGVSTHQNAEAVLEAAIDSNHCDLVMLAVTPAGWYDWKKKVMLEGTPPLRDLKPQIEKARTAGIGLIGMKCGRLIAPKSNAGQGDSSAFDGFYSDEYLKLPLTPHQRSYAYVLEHGMDAVNSDMQNFKHFEENLAASTKSNTYFA